MRSQVSDESSPRALEAVADFVACAMADVLVERALKEAEEKGHRLVLLVGDEPYYSQVGFRKVPKGRATMPGPVDYDRLLVFELADGAFEGVCGAIRPDWSRAR